MQLCPLRPYYLVGATEIVTAMAEQGLLFVPRQSDLSFLSVREFPKLDIWLPYRLHFLACLKYGHVTKFCAMGYE